MWRRVCGRENVQCQNNVFAFSTQSDWIPNSSQLSLQMSWIRMLRHFDSTDSIFKYLEDFLCLTHFEQSFLLTQTHWKCQIQLNYMSFFFFKESCFNVIFRRELLTNNIFPLSLKISTFTSVFLIYTLYIYIYTIVCITWVLPSRRNSTISWPIKSELLFDYFSLSVRTK